MNFYLCDGSPESFFTAVFEAYRDRNCVITSDNEIQLALDGNIVYVHSDGEKCERVLRGISKFDFGAVNDIITVLRSCDNKKEQVCFAYIKKFLECKKPVKNAFNLPEVIDFNNILSKVNLEVHHFKGFLRFKETAGGAFYAPYSPDNDITDLLMPHFAERFCAEKFVIHDTVRRIAGLYDGNGWITACVGNAEICLSEDEKNLEGLWKKYYKSVNISERPHEKQMKRSMPVRYWKFLPEKND